ncbi:tyrosine-type recombinase/integrase [Malacoplasma iowae]|uniref:tyrosine-type recombinase/integrase n=1 Tax=Malacoplasma iowae TaxID=2116 RepID=UPI003872BB73|nr:tyrosine-type recombinase/integrase [Malacoplasma iowae]
MKYETWLKNKNLSKNTINVYLKNYDLWKKYLNDKKPNKTLFTKYIKTYSRTHKPRSVRLLYSSILSIFRFEKRWKLLNECKDIHLPKEEVEIKPVISLDHYKKVLFDIQLTNWFQKRDWLIFSFLFLTGTRVSELLIFNKKDIYDNNKYRILGKGNKIRTIYLNDYLVSLLDNWKPNRIAISKNNKILTIKQINIIIKKLSSTYFNKLLTPHSLRRSFATNLLKSNINIEIVRRTLGHSNINTTSRYIQYTDDEILNEIKNLMK